MRLLSSSLLLLLNISLSAQIVPLLADLSLTGVPKNAAPENYEQPPMSPVRAMAEWEEIQALAISWKDEYKTLLTQIVKATQPECTVLILCSSSSNITQVKTYLTSQGVDWTQNVRFESVPTNTIWLRDYGPHNVYANGVDSLLLIDWIYNRDRQNDNTAPIKIGQKLSLPVFSSNLAPYDLVNTGGNFMSDGLSTGFSSKLVFRNNNDLEDGECGFNVEDVFGSSNHDESGIDSIMQRYLGIDRYIKMEELPYDCIHHIDMHMKLLDEETLLVGQYPMGISDGPQIEENIAYLQANFKSAFGTPYKIVRMPMPSSPTGTWPSQNGYYYTYLNSVFVNKTVLVPTYNLPSDEAALQQWQALLPGYKIIGINSSLTIPYDGALHCITHEIGVNDPLLIVHQKIDDSSAPSGQGWPVRAQISHRSGIESATLWYALNNSQNWTSTAMQPDGGNDYEALIPIQAAGTQVHYYIEANANSGKKMHRPIVAPEGHWTFSVPQGSGVTDLIDIAVDGLFPNPSRGFATLSIRSERDVNATISLLNALGQPLRTLHDGPIPEGLSAHKIEANGLPSGPYWVNIQTSEGSSTKKLIIR
jgi:agmatine deiminase